MFPFLHIFEDFKHERSNLIVLISFEKSNALPLFISPLNFILMIFFLESSYEFPVEDPSGSFDKFLCFQFL